MTYNVHRCIGTGGQDSTADVAELCAAAQADVIALQELDAPETDDDEGAHHARDIAQRLSMQLLFCRTFRRNVGFYGHALLSRHPLELCKVTTFPGLPGKASEPRGAIWARLDAPWGTVDVLSTHLGVRRRERALQSAELISAGWLRSGEMRRPTVLCGDLNALPVGTTYKRLGSVLADAQRAIPDHVPLPTFPSRFPVFRLDHVFVSDEIVVRSVEVPRDARARRASDHLPLIVNLELP